MWLPGTNLDGTLVVVGSFSVAYGIGKLANVAHEGPLTFLGGVLVVAIDLFLRWIRRRNEMEKPPRLIFIPTWMFGVLWIGLGIFYSLKG
jgi:hypothetical protein